MSRQKKGRRPGSQAPGATGGRGGRSGTGARAGSQGSGGSGGRSFRGTGAASQDGSGSSHRVLFDLARPVFFVGFMGAGKTSVARRLARVCGVASVDMDTYLERREERKVSDIFAEEGEEGFRAIETDVLRELAAKEPLLVSCGGGVVVRPENREILRSAGFVVYLQVTADEAQGRISDLSTRPLFNDLEAARRRNAERLPLYLDVADAVVDTAGKSVGALAYEVRGILRKEGILCQRPR